MPSPVEPATEELVATVLLGAGTSDPDGAVRDLASLMARLL